MNPRPGVHDFMGPNSESLLRIALVHAEDASITEVQKGLDEINRFRTLLVKGRSRMSAEERVKAAGCVQELDKLERRLRGVLTQAQGTREFVALGGRAMGSA